ncbi:hypothetical protein GCM10011613_17450 [Cellvibrio zantedeschiae]|uniref:Rhamnogalacturonase A/B/Epimerase-like pectate lyase domain-containing protein n=1 Tax=Cellvibrio zantedeschiae TaxID=1237077 RepID=A0ABQ3AZT3_9GAMM|nr:hypothetical protein GCM10011613_17450 [Cellvibrio zantedeschiae]
MATGTATQPKLTIKNLDVGDELRIYKETECEGADIARSISVSDKLQLQFGTPLELGHHHFSVAVKKSGQNNFVCTSVYPEYSVVPVTSQFVNVKDFGARGDGVTDDTAAINAALASAKTQAKHLYIPAGTYICNQATNVNNSDRLLTASIGGWNNAVIFGDGASSKLVTSLNTKSTLMYLYAYSKVTNFKIYNVSFVSNHAPAQTEYQYGLFLQGTGVQNMVGADVSDNQFIGFGGALQGQGLNGLNIAHNEFLAPRGHDESKFGTTPAVFVWLFDNANGLCNDVKVHHNFADGFSGDKNLANTVSKRAMDGFFLGNVYGLEVYRNKTQNFIEEHYIFLPPSTAPDTAATIYAHDNYLDASIIPGSQLDNGQPKKDNYGFRSDASHVRIENNDIINFTLGILVRTFDNLQLQAKDIVITKNRFSSGDDSGAYTVRSAIYVIGNTNFALDNVEISQNHIELKSAAPTKSYDALTIAYVKNTVVKENEILQLYSGVSAFSVIARNYMNVSSVEDFANTVQGSNLIPYKKNANDQINFH